MAEVVGINIQVGGNAVESVGSLKKQLREAQSEVAALSDKFGATSEQAINAAKRAAQLKDAIGDAKTLTDAYNPDAKFKAFGNALQGVVGGFTAVQGALGLVGVESDKVQETLLKVQSAMALSQGINSVTESIDSFKTLGKQTGITSAALKVYNFVMGQTAVQTTATSTASKAAAISMRILRGIIASLGIGALIIGVTTLIGKISSWVSSTDNAKAANELLNRALEEQNRLFDKNKQKLQQAREDAIAEAKIKGASAEEIFRINKEYSQKDIDLAKQNKTQKDKTLLDYEKNLEKTTDANGRTIVRGSEEEIAQYNKLKEEKIKADEELGASQRKAVVETQQEQIRVAEDGRAKAKQSSQKQREEQKKEREERIQANKDADEQIRKQAQDNFLLAIKDDDERAKKKLDFDLQNRLLEIDALNADETKKKELRLQAIRSTALEISNIEDQLKKEKTEKEEEETKQRQEKEKKNEEDRVARIRQQYEYDKKVREEFQQADLEATKFLQDQKVALIDAGINLISALAGKNEKVANVFYAIQKAVEIGRIITSTTGAIAKIKADTAAIPAFIGPGIPNPAFIAATLAGTKKILGLKIGAASSIASIAASSISKFKGGGSSNVGGTQDTGSIGGGGSAPLSPNAPIQNTLTQLDQATINRLGSASNRAYVLESDVTNSQERITRINRAARLG